MEIRLDVKEEITSRIPEDPNSIYSCHRKLYYGDIIEGLLTTLGTGITIIYLLGHTIRTLRRDPCIGNVEGDLHRFVPSPTTSLCLPNHNTNLFRTFCLSQYQVTMYIPSSREYEKKAPPKEPLRPKIKCSYMSDNLLIPMTFR